MEKYPFRKRNEDAQAGAEALAECPHMPTSEALALLAGDYDERFQRYIAGTPEIAAGCRRIVKGDGPTAQFIDFVIEEEADGAFPYVKFHRSVVATFQAGWEKMEAEEGAEQVGEWREAYHDLVARDATVAATNIVIDEKTFRKGVELGPEMTWYALMVGIAAREAGIEDEATIRDIALANVPLLVARARKNVTHTFSLENYYNHVDCGVARINERGRLTLPYRFYREGDPQAPEPAGKTVGCVADLVRMHDEDKFSALRNSMFACINKQHELGLFNPQLAYVTWQQCEELHARLEAETAELRRIGWRHTAIEQYTFGEICEIL